MCRILFLFFYLASFANLAVGQINRARSWYFGEGINLFFQSDNNLKITFGLKGLSYEGTSVWNDENGNLKFYSDGDSLYINSNKRISDFSLGGAYSGSQPLIITSLNDTIFHIFGTSPEFKWGGLRYSNYNINTGKYSTKGKQLNPAISEAQAHVNHQNGRWQWVVSHSRLGDT